ncbi:hypothetical protein PROFUN_03232 [Planoprotostelium fungivorum]|uniref:Sfi1 spindle body domain-containing protein n=1 Tax=Planoprotostelium fungivorum TaxID=1890364 RepID=A0A2P6NX25_9EUKA|nr:hypothetical protein PROFUN_03232 [Planoprotostelium fungivorum]
MQLVRAAFILDPSHPITLHPAPGQVGTMTLLCPTFDIIDKLENLEKIQLIELFGSYVKRPRRVFGCLIICFDYVFKFGRFSTTSKLASWHNSLPPWNIDLPIEDCQNTIKALFNIVKNNWMNQLESVKQKHTLGYLCGLAGIWKTTMLFILRAYMQALAKEELDKEFKESIHDYVYITFSLGNGDSWEGEEFDNLVVSRIFICFSQGCSWATCNNGTLSARSFGTVEISKEDSTTITAHFKTYIVPIFARTLLPEQFQFFAISNFTTEDIQLPLSSADHTLGICYKLQTINSHPALQDSKVWTLLNHTPIETRTDILERFFEIESANMYKILSSFGEDGKQLVLYSLANVSLSLLEGTRMREKLQDFSFKGCLYLNDGHITILYHMLSPAIKEYRIPFTIHETSNKVHWQDFEKSIYQVQLQQPHTLQRRLTFMNLNKKLWVAFCILLPMVPSSAFQAIQGSSDNNMIEKWFTQAKGVIRGDKFSSPLLLVYITNCKLDRDLACSVLMLSTWLTKTGSTKRNSAWIVKLVEELHHRMRVVDHAPVQPLGLSELIASLSTPKIMRSKSVNRETINPSIFQVEQLSSSQDLDISMDSDAPIRLRRDMTPVSTLSMIGSMNRNLFEEMLASGNSSMMAKRMVVITGIEGSHHRLKQYCTIELERSRNAFDNGKERGATVQKWMNALLFWERSVARTHLYQYREMQMEMAREKHRISTLRRTFKQVQLYTMMRGRRRYRTLVIDRFSRSKLVERLFSAWRAYTKRSLRVPILTPVQTRLIFRWMNGSLDVNMHSLDIHAQHPSDVIERWKPTRVRRLSSAVSELNEWTLYQVMTAWIDRVRRRLDMQNRIQERLIADYFHRLHTDIDKSEDKYNNKQATATQLFLEKWRMYVSLCRRKRDDLHRAKSRDELNLKKRLFKEWRRYASKKQLGVMADEILEMRRREKRISVWRTWVDATRTRASLRALVQLRKRNALSRSFDIWRTYTKTQIVRQEWMERVNPAQFISIQHMFHSWCMITNRKKRHREIEQSAIEERRASEMRRVLESWRWAVEEVKQRERTTEHLVAWRLVAQRRIRQEELVKRCREEKDEKRMLDVIRVWKAYAIQKAQRRLYNHRAALFMNSANAKKVERYLTTWRMYTLKEQKLRRTGEAIEKKRERKVMEEAFSGWRDCTDTQSRRVAEFYQKCGEALERWNKYSVGMRQMKIADEFYTRRCRESVLMRWRYTTHERRAEEMKRVLADTFYSRKSRSRVIHHWKQMITSSRRKELLGERHAEEKRRTFMKRIIIEWSNEARRRTDERNKMKTVRIFFCRKLVRRCLRGWMGVCEGKRESELMVTRFQTTSLYIRAGHCFRAWRHRARFSQLQSQAMWAMREQRERRIKEDCLRGWVHLLNRSKQRDELHRIALSYRERSLVSSSFAIWFKSFHIREYHRRCIERCRQSQRLHLQRMAFEGWKRFCHAQENRRRALAFFCSIKIPKMFTQWRNVTRDIVEQNRKMEQMRERWRLIHLSHWMNIWHQRVQQTRLASQNEERAIAFYYQILKKISLKLSQLREHKYREQKAIIHYEKKETEKAWLMLKKWKLQIDQDNEKADRTRIKIEGLLAIVHHRKLCEAFQQWMRYRREAAEGRRRNNEAMHRRNREAMRLKLCRWKLYCAIRISERRTLSMALSAWRHALQVQLWEDKRMRDRASDILLLWNHLALQRKALRLSCFQVCMNNTNGIDGSKRWREFIASRRDEYQRMVHITQYMDAQKKSRILEAWRLHVSSATALRRAMSFKSQKPVDKGAIRVHINHRTNDHNPRSHLFGEQYTTEASSTSTRRGSECTPREG